ncbi:nucleotidyltransferase family protein [Billgrantia aerodenitrificans]|nr:nucleotidyltransferase family protein [Halomonas aerodenitrificans]
MHETSSRLLAEGVKTQAELEVMRDMGVHKVQGYLFGAAGSVACPRLSLQALSCWGFRYPMVGYAESVKCMKRETSTHRGYRDMNRTKTLQLLRDHLPLLSREYGVTSLRLFGSMSRDEARDDSDIDILVSFDGPATSARYFGVQFYLEDLLGHPVDLVTDKALRPELKPYIEREAVRV